jgi:small subunit ribosomal protein S4
LKERSDVKFTGPKVKKSRALGVALTPKAQGYMNRRPYGPGEHGQRRKRRPSEYAMQLLEKQRLRYQYNISEAQLRKAFLKASRMPGSTGDNLVELLETRLDALVLRAGLAPTIYAARQAVNHGHFLVNGRKATIPSQRLRPGDVISVRERSRTSPLFRDMALDEAPVPYLVTDAAHASARLERAPRRDEVPVICAEHLVVEHYSR